MSAPKQGAPPAARAGGRPGVTPQAPAAAAARLANTGLFDEAFYLAQTANLAQRGSLTPAGAAARAQPLLHFCTQGWGEALKPNPYFDVAWYLARNPDIASAGVNPLVHYLEFGEAEGRPPSSRFMPAWYRARYGIADDENALAHFLARRRSGRVAPVPVFDPAWYLERNPDVAAGGADPFEHFCDFGAAEGRDPAQGFELRFYKARYAALIGDDNPLLHYIAHRAEGLLTARPPAERLIAGAVAAATRPGPEFETVRPIPASAPRRALLLAYYLPQFHAIPENDAWWGAGFTDWTNLARATPRFAGHYQPRAPRDLGFYSLDDPTVLARQIDLAKGAGIGGFVFYHYWFDGRRLLERPMERLLADASLDMRFCLMWANENWTRRWDGLGQEVLLAQEYLAAQDIPLIDDFARHFADPRYIRLDGRPLLMIYRAREIPDTAATVARWRGLFRERHGEDPILVMAQTFRDHEPTPYGLDGAVEFPPHKLVDLAPTWTGTLDLFDPDFTGDVVDYDGIAQAALAQPEPAFPLIRTVCPSWDNDPRRQGKGLVLHGATPAGYQAWLDATIDRAIASPAFGTPVVCINAWNEWAEGAYLEPDLHFGAAFLNATGRAALGHAPGDSARSLLLIGHDALEHGAQMILLNLVRSLRRNHGIAPRVLLLAGGPLLPEFQAEGEVDVAPDEGAILRHVGRYRALGIRAAIVNTAAAAWLCKPLAAQGIEATLLLHEMPRVLAERSLRGAVRQGMAAARATVFPAATVRDRVAESCAAATDRAIVLPQGNYHRVGPSPKARAALRRRLGLGERDFLVLAVGFADLRKGFDLLLQVFRLLHAARDDVHVLWLGDIHLWLRDHLGREIAAAEASGRFRRVDFTAEVTPYYAAADVYALTSREDPFPTTAIEALSAGVPVVAFEGGGGIAELLAEADIAERGAGRAVAEGDVRDFADAVLGLLDHDALAALRAPLAHHAAARFDFDTYAQRLLHVAMPERIAVSCAVISYNHERHVAERLGSVFGQTYPVEEVLFLDDASSDESVAVAERVAAEWRRDLTVIRRRRNSGSPFGQWREAAGRARGDFLWLAEGDDSAEPRFLASLAESLADAPDAVMAVAAARAIDAEGNTVMPDYQRYFVAGGVTGLAGSGVWKGRDFARNFLASRNLILNVSAVLFRRAALLAALEATGDDLADWRIAGDWRVYLELLAETEAPVVWRAEPLDLHRRHAQGVTQSLDAGRHLAELARAQAVAAERLGLDATARAAQAAALDEARAFLTEGCITDLQS